MAVLIVVGLGGGEAEAAGAGCGGVSGVEGDQVWKAFQDAVVVAGQGGGDRPDRFVGGAEDVFGAGVGRQADGDDEGGGLGGDVQAQGAAQGLDAADDAAGGISEDDGVHAGDVDALGDRTRVGEDRGVGAGEAGEGVFALLGGGCPRRGRRAVRAGWQG